MEWTKRIPKMDGYYFIRTDVHTSILLLNGGKAVVPLVGTNSIQLGVETLAGIEWAGPIPMPYDI